MRGSRLRSQLFGAISVVVLICVALTIGLGLVLTQREVQRATVADVGKQADLIVLAGDPSTTIADIHKVETVFKRGIGFDPAKLIASVTGRVGLW